MPYLFLSARKADLSFARKVKTWLEDKGRAVWLQQESDFTDATVSTSLLEDVIQNAGAVIALVGGDPDELAIARRFEKPIIALGFETNPLELLSEIDALFPEEEVTSVEPLPELGDTEKSHPVRWRYRRSSAWRQLLLIVGVFALVIVGLLYLRDQTTNQLNDVVSSNNSTLAFLASETAIMQTPVLTSTEFATVTAVSLLLPSATSQPITDTLTFTSTAAVTDTATAKPVTPSATRKQEIYVPPTVFSPTVANTTAATSTPTPTVTATSIDTATAITPTFARTLATMTARPFTPSFTPSNTASLTPTPSFTPTATFTPTPTFTPTSTPTIPSLNVTLIPEGSDNSVWTPIEQQIHGLAMIYVPSGCFVSGKGQPGNLAGESLCLDPYWIGKTEVTNAQYAACVDAGACSAPATISSRTHQDYYLDSRFSNYPVINITWEQAQAFSAWVGGTLPSQLQWRYAAQGPADWTYPWGSDAPNLTLLNFNGNIGDVTAVGSYPNGASWVGALDMAGNVWEWTSTSTTSPNRVICGGSWNSYDGLVSANAHAENPDTDSNAYTGFRVIMDAAS